MCTSFTYTAIMNEKIALANFADWTGPLRCENNLRTGLDKCMASYIGL